MTKLHQKLHEQHQINEAQFQQLENIESGKVVSLYYELRLLLYLGILLFSGGVGYIVYENMSDIGHLAMMLLILILIITGFYFVDKKSKPYSRLEVTVDVIYFDYGVVLQALLIISLLTYVQVYFDLVDILLRWSSLFSGCLFVYLAYRYDNTMVLAMGITAFAATLGLSVSPVNWAQGDFVAGMDLYVTGIVYGIFLIGIGSFSETRNVKKHFGFTYHNLGLLLVYFGALSLVFDSPLDVGMAFVLILVASGVAWYCWVHRKFLFFLYSCVSAYIALTYLVMEANMSWEAMVFYFPITCIGGVVLLIKKRSHFSDDK